MQKKTLNLTELEFLLTRLRDLVISGKFDEPKIILERLRPVYPTNINLLNLLGIIYLNLKRYEKALDCFESILELNLDDPSDALNNRAVILLELNRFEEALEGFKKAVSINDKEFSYFLNLGKLLYKMSRFNESLDMLNQALKINPTSFETHASKGLVLEELKDFNAAIECYNDVIHFNPEYAPAFWNKGLILLKLGNYKEGWELYEWRWKDLQINSARIFHEPTWTGQDNVKEKKIFVYSEQGLGDAILMLRYLLKLKKQFASVIIEVDSSLESITRNMDEDFIIVKKGERPPHFDYQCPLMTLPLAFKTELNSIPFASGYIKAPKDFLLKWGSKFNCKKNIPRIGLVWSGSKKINVGTSYHKDRRSIDISQLKNILKLPFEFHSLQKEIDQSDLKIIETELLPIHLHHREINDFADTSALIEYMDLIISIDTSVAHLSGAMGKDTWILLAENSDFRWLINRLDSPWFDSVKLFRQEIRGNWIDVIEDVRFHLEKFKKNS